jgi:hypothetical protein
MISMFHVVVHRKRSGGQFIFGAPMFAMWLVLAPLGLVLLPFFLLACLICGINPLTPISAFCLLLAAVKGTQVEFEDDSHGFEFRVA